MNTRFALTEKDIPTHWYNVLADVPKPLPPPLHPGTREPVTPEMMTAIFPENLVMQEMTTPLLWMHTLGHDFIPPKIHAGGLRYHGMAPTVSHLYDLGLIEAKAYPQTKIFEAAVMFARTEGIIPAPEPSHAIRAAIDEAIQARAEGKKKVILFNLCGHGMLDLASYDAFLAGKLQD